MGILGLAIFVKAACELIVVCVARDSQTRSNFVTGHSGASQ